MSEACLSVALKAYTEMSMRRLAGILAILILLLTASPMLACMADGVKTQEESACCRSMHGKCAGMEKMGCCRTEVRSDEQPQRAVSAPLLDLHLAVVHSLEPRIVPTQGVLPTLPWFAAAHSPPGLIIARIAVLRI